MQCLLIHTYILWALVDNPKLQQCTANTVAFLLTYCMPLLHHGVKKLMLNTNLSWKSADKVAECLCLYKACVLSAFRHLPLYVNATAMNRGCPLIRAYVSVTSSEQLLQAAKRNVLGLIMRNPLGS